MLAQPIPLSEWADAELDICGSVLGAPEIGALSGRTLLGERGALNGFTVPGKVSAGGGCRLFATRDGYIALNLARPDDRAMLPALFGDTSALGEDDAALASRLSQEFAAEVVARARTLGFAIAALDDRQPGHACEVMAKGLKTRRSSSPPLVIDLSALWAGPLSTSLLQRAGATVVKVESFARPDTMRSNDPAMYSRLNHGKASVALDFRAPAQRDALIALIRRAQIVVEASRPRALRQLGIDARALVQQVPGLVWITITGHGVTGDAANWTGFGDDCGVAGGLSAALYETTGAIGFVGDACADPLTGIHAARLALLWRRSGVGAHLAVSMSGVIAKALTAERRRNARSLRDALEQWTGAVGKPVPAVEQRQGGRVSELGEDNDAWLRDC